MGRPVGVVEYGPRPPWGNQSERPATLAFVLIGAHRQAFDRKKIHD